MMKKLVSIAIWISLVIGLIGCGSKNLEYPGEEKIQEYVQAAIGLVSDENDELSQAIIASVDKGIHNKTIKYGLPTY